jgi:hypothetical protein
VLKPPPTLSTKSNPPRRQRRQADLVQERSRGRPWSINRSLGIRLLAIPRVTPSAMDRCSAPLPDQGRHSDVESVSTTMLVWLLMIFLMSVVSMPRAASSVMSAAADIEVVPPARGVRQPAGLRVLGQPPSVNHDHDGGAGGMKARDILTNITDFATVEGTCDAPSLVSSRTHPQGLASCCEEDETPRGTIRHRRRTAYGRGGGPSLPVGKCLNDSPLYKKTTQFAVTSAFVWEAGPHSTLLMSELHGFFWNNKYPSIMTMSSSAVGE